MNHLALDTPLAVSPHDACASDATREIRRFCAAMAMQGLTAHTARMLWDPLYARACCALAHTMANDELRHLAVAVFRRYELLATPGGTDMCEARP